MSLNQRLLLSGCSNRGCWRQHSQRDDDLDIVVGIVAAILLFFGIVISFMASGGCMSGVVPLSTTDSHTAYDRATVFFYSLFQHPVKVVTTDAVDATPQRTVLADVVRSRRDLADISMIMNLSTETNIQYSGNTLNTNIIAQQGHLEYDFGSTSELETLAKQFIQTKQASLPTIFESSRGNSFTNLAVVAQDNRKRNRQFRREIILFSGSEEKNHWLKEEEEDVPSGNLKVSKSNDFLWVFDAASDEDDTH